MKLASILLASSLCLSPVTYGMAVVQPDANKAKFQVSSPDDTVASLGKVSFIIDWAAEHDSLFDLQIRKKGLTLKDGRPITVFSYDKDAGVIVAAASPVTHISIASIKDNEALVSFYNSHNEVIAPHKKDIQLFDLDFKPYDFDYQPSSTPQTIGVMDVSILIDRSGSMSGHMSGVLSATRSFMANLPEFTRCHILTFNNQVKWLTSASSPMSCPDSLWAIRQPINTEGGTALFSALHTAFTQKKNSSSGIPNLVITLTDGLNNQPFALTHKQLIALKKSTNSKLLTFWAGSYDPSHLKGLADHETISRLKIKHDLEAFFGSIGVSLSGLQRLKLK